VVGSQVVWKVGEARRCGLCNKTNEPFMRMECCGGVVCDTEGEYEMHSYERTGQCARNHRCETGINSNPRDCAVARLARGSRLATRNIVLAWRVEDERLEVTVDCFIVNAASLLIIALSYFVNLSGLRILKLRSMLSGSPEVDRWID